MNTATSKVTTKGLHSSTSIRWIEKKEGILMVPDSEDPIIAARGMLKGSGVLKAYLKEKDREKKREDKRFASAK